MGFEGIPKKTLDNAQKEHVSLSRENKEGAKDSVEEFLMSMPAKERRSAIEAMVSELPPHEQSKNRRALLGICEAIEHDEDRSEKRRATQDEMLKPRPIKDLTKEEQAEFDAFEFYEDKSKDQKDRELQERRDMLNETQKEHADKLERRLEYLRSIRENNND